MVSITPYFPGGVYQKVSPELRNIVIKPTKTSISTQILQSFRYFVGHELPKNTQDNYYITYDL